MSKKPQPTQDKKLLPLSSDIVFKRVFSREENKDLLKSILEAILNINIKDISILNPNIVIEKITDKPSVLDIKALLNNNTIVNIEMQVQKKSNFLNRDAFYVSKIASDELKIAEDYNSLKKSISISILCENLLDRNSYFNAAHMKFEPCKPEHFVNLGYKHEQELATDKLEMIFIELQKFIKKNPDSQDLLTQWMWLIAGEMEKIDMSDEKYESIKKAVDVLEEMSANREEWEYYQSVEKARKDYVSDINAAKREGKEEIAKNMLKENINIATISKLTGLTKDEIENLK